MLWIWWIVNSAAVWWLSESRDCPFYFGKQACCPWARHSIFPADLNALPIKSKMKKYKDIKNGWFSASSRSTDWFLSLSSEPPPDVSVFNSARLCMFSQSMSKEESMRPFMQMAHWPVEVMKRRQPPRHWLRRVMPWKIDGEQNHWLSFQLYHSQLLVTLPERLAVRDSTS